MLSFGSLCVLLVLGYWLRRKPWVLRRPRLYAGFYVVLLGLVLFLGVDDIHARHATPLTHAEVAETQREILPFDDGWRFMRFGLMPDGSRREEPKELEVTNFDDSGWRLLDLPHDWGIEGPFRVDLPNRTGKLPWAGIGWYRKTFHSPESDRLKRIFVDFDGAMSNCSVWLNGQFVGKWPYGYASFQLELTGKIRVGEDNVIAVRLDNKPDSSRWYPGGGIYRHVRLVKTAPVHVAHWGTFATTPQVTASNATERIVTIISNQSDADADVVVKHRIFGPGSTSNLVAQWSSDKVEVDAGSKVEIDASLHVTSPRLWDLKTPDLYEVQTTVMQNGIEVDTYKTRIGIRAIEFTADKGFFLNGESVKLNGVCMHHDLGPLGTAVNTRALERQIEILQSMGCNAIRTSHNPPAPELVELCDRMGMLLLVEAFDCWTKGKTENDYGRHFLLWHRKDLSSMVRHYRNDPSVIMWSTGNEIREQGRLWHFISRRLTRIVKQNDPTRPVTAGCNVPEAGFNGFQKTVDVFGYNYKPQLYSEFRKQHPSEPLYGSETASCISSRGEYFFPVDKGPDKGCYWFQVSSYDLYAPKHACPPAEEFEAQDRNPSVCGEFVWTGFDYLGEPNPYDRDRLDHLGFLDEADHENMQRWIDSLGGKPPSRSSYFGIVDLCGFPKDRYFLYQARWRPELPMAHILPHWNWPERVGQVTPVHVYTSGDEAELFLNGESLGRKRKGPYEYRLRWDNVVYQPGELRVIAYKDGKVWAEECVKTTGAAAVIDLSSDRSIIGADGSDLAFVTVKVVDGDGLVVPRADNLVEFTITGPGDIIAVGNGNPVSHEPFVATKRKAFNGLALAVIRSRKGEAGSILLRAKSDGLQGSEITVTAR